ncbi:MAG: hypothetical protein AAF543_10675 [Pseudomonadota bacterium]
MSIDVSEAIDLAKDLLKTSNDFRAHDKELSDQFAGRAFEICDDLGIDRALIGELTTSAKDEPPADDEGEDTVVEMTPMTPAQTIEEDTRQTSQQLRDLLQQQARVLQNARDMPSAERPKAARRSFSLFGRSNHQIFGGVQSASA